MDEINQEVINNLLNHKNKYCISIYIPTHVIGKDTQEDHIHLKDMLNQVESSLTEEGMKKIEIDSLLSPARELVQDEQFWNFQLNGLAMFIGPNYFKYFKEPVSFEELYVIDPQFYIKPLISLINHNEEFYLLAISEKYVRAYHATRFTINELKIKSMPRSMQGALWYKKIQKEIQFHTGTGVKPGTRGEAMFHGQATWIDKHKQYIVEYFREVNKSLYRAFSGKNAPLVLAIDDGLFSLYHEAYTYRNLATDFIRGNPEHTPLHELYHKAWRIVEKHIENKEKSKLEKYKNLMGSKLFTTDIEDIITAAYDGRIQNLFVENNKQVWGKYDYKNRKISAKDNKDTPTNSELLNLAAIHTYWTDGNVYVLPHEKMPTNTEAAAILRY